MLDRTEKKQKSQQITLLNKIIDLEKENDELIKKNEDLNKEIEKYNNKKVNGSINSNNNSSSNNKTEQKVEVEKPIENTNNNNERCFKHPRKMLARRK